MPFQNNVRGQVYLTAECSENKNKSLPKKHVCQKTFGDKCNGDNLVINTSKLKAENTGLA